MDELIKKLLSVLIEHITTEVSKNMQDLVDTAVEKALYEYDPTDHTNFNDSVRDVIFEGSKIESFIKEEASRFIREDDNFDDAVRGVIDNLTFDVTVSRSRY